MSSLINQSSKFWSLCQVRPSDDNRLYPFMTSPSNTTRLTVYKSHPMFYFFSYLSKFILPVYIQAPENDSRLYIIYIASTRTLLAAESLFADNHNFGYYTSIVGSGSRSNATFAKITTSTTPVSRFDKYSDVICMEDKYIISETFIKNVVRRFRCGLMDEYKPDMLTLGIGCIVSDKFGPIDCNILAELSHHLCKCEPA